MVEWYEDCHFGAMLTRPSFGVDHDRVLELKKKEKAAQLEPLKKGFNCIKHGRSGNPHPRFVYLDESLKKIHWTEGGKQSQVCPWIGLRVLYD